MSKSMIQLAQQALDVQDACNLSGVVHAFSAAVTDVRAHLRAEGNESTDRVNTHPVCVLFASKIASLTGCEVGIEFSTAFRICSLLVKVPT
jgi:hypothetical protein